MNELRYTVAGWFAIASVVLVVPLILLGFAVKALPFIVFGVAPVRATLVVLPAYMLCTAAQTFFAAYALYQFRNLLNERFTFHRADGLIMAIILSSIAVTIFVLGARFCYAIGLLSSPGVIAALVLLGLMALLLGVLHIVLARRLLRLEVNPYGLLKPYAYLTMVLGICCVSLVFLPFAGLVDVAAGIVLAIIFFRAAGGEREVEFV